MAHREIEARQIEPSSPQIEAPPTEYRREILLVAPDCFLAGTQGAARVFVLERGPSGMVRPIRGCDIGVFLRVDHMDRPLGGGISDADGSCSVAFEVPEAQGRHAMTVRAQGIELSRPVDIRHPMRLAVDLDKLTYRPGEKIRVRAEVFDAAKGRPLDEASVVFEIDDPKGNKILRRSQTANAFGVAEANLPLADEPMAGIYQVHVLCGGYREKRSVTVSDRAVPVLSASIETTQRYPWLGQPLEGVVTARYWFGAPARGTISGKATLIADREYDLGTFGGMLNEEGRAPFQVALSEQLLDGKKDEKLKAVRLDVSVTDPKQQTAAISKTLRFELFPIRISARPESGFLVPGQENRIWLFTQWSDGTPVSAQATVEIGEQKYDLLTDRNGVASFTVPGTEKKVAAFIRVREATGHYGCKEERFESASKDAFRLRVHSSMIRSGEPLKLEVIAPSTIRTAYIDWSIRGRSRQSKACRLQDGRGTVTLEIPAGMSGLVDAHAYGVNSTGQILCDSRFAWVRPEPDLRVHLKGGEVRVTDAHGRGVQAAVLVDLFPSDKNARPVAPEALATQLSEFQSGPLAYSHVGFKRFENSKWEPERENAGRCSCRNDSAKAEQVLAERRPPGHGWIYVETDIHGKAAAPIRVPYGIGEWRFLARAISSAGLIGEIEGVAQGEADFVSDVALPPTLTRGDVVHVPVTVYNNLDRPQKFRVEALSEAWFEMKEPAVREIVLAPGAIDVAWFRITTKRAGSQTLTARIRGERAGEVQTRRASVAPDGKVFEESSSFMLDRPRKERVSIPKTAVAGSERVELRIVPGPVAQVQEGLEGMLREPHG